MPLDYDAIRKFVEHDESKPDGLSYSDPSIIKAKKKVWKGLGRQFDIINWSEMCTHCFWASLVTAAIFGMIGFWFGASWVAFAGGIGAGFILSIVWSKLSKYWPFR